MRYYWIAFIVLSGILFNCYTSFRHPDVYSESDGYYNIRINDDCMECHRTYPGTLAVLPNGAENDFNWQFYSYGAWWEDVVSFHGSGPENYLAPTGPRLPNPSFENGGQVVVPVPGPAPRVSKPVGDTNSAETTSDNDSRRGFNRRKEATEEPKKRDTPKSTTQKK